MKTDRRRPVTRWRTTSSGRLVRQKFKPLHEPFVWSGLRWALASPDPDGDNERFLFWKHEDFLIHKGASSWCIEAMLFKTRAEAAFHYIEWKAKNPQTPVDEEEN